MSRVSIIIPCHDDGKYLGAALASARTQTHGDCEIIIVDDHSSEPATLKQLARLEASGQRVLHLPAGRHGAAAARNLGISGSSGKYILPLDADDIIAPSYVAKAAAVLDARPEIGICYCQARFFGLKRGVWKLPPYSFSELLLHNMIFISSVFRKADWSRAGGFDESAEFGREDHIFWLTLAASGASVHQIPEILFHYRIKPHSRAARIARRLGERGVALKTFEGRENIYREHLRDLYEHCIDLDIEKRARERLCLWKFCRSLLAAERWTRDMGKRLFGR
ncbi:glycosyltransferase family A protein [uncultured Desulfovibrio sp.]|nr:glycosyltransferase family A protein [uncultured Desulfovibrio sp.]